MKFAIVVFPGSNCDQDCFHIAKDLLGCEAEIVWHAEKNLSDADVVILPGGFAYGDYLRAGALARFSPVMESVTAFARAGGPVLGICNGFQILLEAGLLPGAVRVNRGLRYVCRDVHVRVESTDTPFTRLYTGGEVVTMPIGHMEGNYTASPKVLDALEREKRIVLRYCDTQGRVTDADNPNGADRAIAGIANREGNVVGLMPHPDRCAEDVLGNAAGRKMFESAVAALAAR
ncbi:MAG: phosphoribosylformylglycinamidine synthase subunit PurQ [Thermoanaerobaculia bacterium]